MKRSFANKRYYILGNSGVLNLNFDVQFELKL